MSNFMHATCLLATDPLFGEVYDAEPLSALALRGLDLKLNELQALSWMRALVIRHAKAADLPPIEEPDYPEWW